MRNASLVVSLWMALLVAGCSSLQQNETQYQITGPTGDRGAQIAVSSADREAVKQIVSTLATEWRLQDRMEGSFLPTMIASYSQDWNVTAYPFRLVAFEHEGKIIVDMSQTVPDVGESNLYRARKDHLLEVLREKFGERAVTPTLMNYVRHVNGPVPPPAPAPPGPR